MISLTATSGFGTLGDVSKEIILAGACAILTIGLAWVIDHPEKMSGTAITLAAFGIIALVVRFRGESSGQTTKWKRGRGANPPG